MDQQIGFTFWLSDRKPSSGAHSRGINRIATAIDDAIRASDPRSTMSTLDDNSKFIIASLLPEHRIVSGRANASDIHYGTEKVNIVEE
jgi:hypothetical protein